MIRNNFVDPVLAHDDGLNPDFFESVKLHSLTTNFAIEAICFTLGINQLEAAFPSNRVLARSWMAFVHCPTWIGWTADFGLIWLMVLPLRTASKPTLALYFGVTTVRSEPKQNQLVRSGCRLVL